jgi:hypothetical protein
LHPADEIDPEVKAPHCEAGLGPTWTVVEAVLGKLSSGTGAVLVAAQLVGGFAVVANLRVDIDACRNR